MKIQDYKVGQLVVWETAKNKYLFYVNDVGGSMYKCYWLNGTQAGQERNHYPDSLDFILSEIFCDD